MTTGASTNKGVLVKLNKNGGVLFKTLTIGNSTWLTYSEILRQDDGKYLAMGTRSFGMGYDIEVDRFHPAGNLDVGFANGGRAILDFFSGEAEVGSAIALDSNGHILLGGSGKTLNGSGYDYLLVALALGVIH